MKLEYLPDGSPDAPLIRFFDFDEHEKQLLKQCFESIVSELNQITPLHELPFIESIDSCKVWIALHDLRLEDENAVLATSEAQRMFTWMMTKDQWNEAIELTAAYTPPPHSYQWLTDDLGIQILLSQSGQW
jgi:hypothetical protein